MISVASEDQLLKPDQKDKFGITHHQVRKLSQKMYHANDSKTEPLEENPNPSNSQNSKIAVDDLFA